MNPIKKLFENISDEDLMTGIIEIMELERTGVLVDGIVRNYIRMTGDITGFNNASDLLMGISNFHREAAVRWLKLKTNII